MRGIPVVTCLIALTCFNSGVLAKPAAYNMLDLQMPQPTLSPDQSPENDVDWTDLFMALGRSLRPSPCTCEMEVCECCQPIKIPKLGIDTRACANVSLLPPQIGASFTLTIDGKILKKTVSVKNPDPVCVDFPGKFGAEICGELYKLSASSSNFEGCARLEGKLLGESVATLNLGCFKKPFKNTAEAHFSMASNSIAKLTKVAPGASVDDASCSCSVVGCQCCLQFPIEVVKIEFDVCIDFKFFPPAIGISLSVNFDGKVTLSLDIDGTISFGETLSMQDPPPICVPFEGGKLCAVLYNLTLKPDNFSGCGLLEVEHSGHVVAKIDLGCFRLPQGLTENIPIKKVALSRGKMSESRLFEAALGRQRAVENDPLSHESLPGDIQLDPDMQRKVEKD